MLSIYHAMYNLIFISFPFFHIQSIPNNFIRSILFCPVLFLSVINLQFNLFTLSHLLQFFLLFSLPFLLLYSVVFSNSLQNQICYRIATKRKRTINKDKSTHGNHVGKKIYVHFNIETCTF